ncbi:SdrD B-like domain-containing protein, partial [Azohydromonas lata]|uniref:SdrD B-like domain-containing protein n=1 Tax=Azohydromonas lata TaxID=45677 RepID=UPI000B04C33C
QGDYYFGELRNVISTLTGRVWRDNNHSRTYDAGEPTMGGWTVQLQACADGGTGCGAADTRIVATATTAQDGSYSIGNVTSGNYRLRFVNPQSHVVGGVWPTDPLINQGSNAPKAGMPWISIEGDLPQVVQNQDLPLDPGGVVYDSLDARPVAGAGVHIDGPAGFNPAAHLLGGTATLVTGPTGEYQFFFLPSAPAGTYKLSVTPPAGYRNSTLLPPAASALDMATCTAPGLKLDDVNGVDPCLVSPQGRPALPITAPYFLALQYPGSSAGAQSAVNNHLPLDRISALATLIELRKTTSKLTVNKGDPVPYTITARYTGASTVAGVSLVDTLPPGFKYLDGSLTVQTLTAGAVVPARPLLQGRQLTLENLRFAPGETKKIQMVLAVGVGVGEGDYVNSAVARRAAGDVSNT